MFFLTESQNQSLGLTVLYVPYWLDNGTNDLVIEAAGMCPYPCRANMAHIRQSKPNSGLGFQVKVPATF